MTPRLLIPKRHTDLRGWFSESFHEARLQAFGINHRFVQDNLSQSAKAGTLRGLHFQRPPAAQAKLIAVLRGKIFDVAVDVRNGSPTYGKHVATELSAETGHQLYIPIGFAHGFVSLVDECLVMYKTSHYYAPELDGGVRWDDPDIAIRWPVDPTLIITSEKDRKLGLLRDFKSPFAYDGALMPDHIERCSI